MHPDRSVLILRLSCPDTIGVVSTVTSYLSQRRANITEAQHFLDLVSNRSVMRIVFELIPGSDTDIDVVRRTFDPVAASLGMEWSLHPAADRMPVLVAVSREGHCLNSLLHRWSTGSMPVDVVGVVSNHENQRRLVEWHGLPFHYLPIANADKASQEAELLKLFNDSGAELLILARYMQILSGDLCQVLAGRAINIHHSFLPGFKGAKPYHQAYARGVKLIGATAHYVNEDLDEGPIIAQAVEAVDHTMSPEQLTTLGHGTESLVLNRAVQWHAEHRVFEFGNRTVVLK
jgi:formyltetrahydrofolate deformylase